MSARCLAGGLVVLAACHHATAPAAPVPPPPASEVRVVLAAAKPGAPAVASRGTLAVTWSPAGELPTVLAFRDMVARAYVVPGGDVDVAHPVAVRLPAKLPPGKLTLHAFVDVSHFGVGMMFGAGSGTLAGDVDVEVGPTGAVRPATIEVSPTGGGAPEPACAGKRDTLETLDAPEVAGTIGNPTARHICVRLPPDYAAHATAHYPVIYVLPGLFGEDPVGEFGQDPEGAIVVGIDTSTKSGSSYLVDTPTGGAWDAFVAQRVLPYIDGHYRTIAQANARAFVGHSTGAFNAVAYALRHPELVGVVGAASPDGLDFDVWLRATPAGPIKPWIRGFARTEHALGGAGQFISYAVDWSPTPHGEPPGYAWPFAAGDAPVAAVIDRWVANTPGAWLADPAKVARMKSFAGNILFTVGDQDEFDLAPPTIAFSQELAAAGIANELIVTPGAGHLTKADEHHAAIVKFCLAHLVKVH